jgi:hypothetical protein
LVAVDAGTVGRMITKGVGVSVTVGVGVILGVTVGVEVAVDVAVGVPVGVGRSPSPISTSSIHQLCPFDVAPLKRTLTRSPIYPSRLNI